MINEDWYWPGLSEQNLGVRVGFSVYLPDHIRNLTVRREWEEDLRRDVATATAEALSADEHDIAWAVEIEQVGPTAQELRQVFLWIEDLPQEVLTDLLVVGAERSLAAFYGWLRHRMNSRRRRLGTQEVAVDIEFHSNTLAELCKEHAAREYGVIATQVDIWTKKSEGILQRQAWSPNLETPFLIVVNSDTKELSYLVKPDASVKQLRVNGVPSTVPLLIPNIPVPLDDSVPFAIPQGFDWPSQDGIDRSNHIAILAGARPDPVAADNFTKSFLESVTREVVAELFPDFDSQGIKVQNHEIGPAAGGIDDFVVTLFENRDAIFTGLSAVADTWAIYEIVSRVRKRIQSADAREANKGHDVRFWLPAGTLAIICEEFVRRSYHPRAQLTTEWYCLSREFYGGYVSPGHPNESIEYLVMVSTSKGSYRFKVLGTGQVTSHSVRYGRIDAELPNPDLFAAASREIEGHADGAQ